MSRQVSVVTEGWKANLLYLFLGAVLTPVLVAFLAASIVGLLLVPVLFLLLLVATCFGFLGVLVRLGRVFVRGQEEPLTLFGAGLVGLVLVRGPALAGRMLSIFASDLFLAVGTFLKAVGGIALFVSLLYGFGCGLTAARRAQR
jgi:hypothetical protein